MAGSRVVVAVGVHLELGRIQPGPPRSGSGRGAAGSTAWLLIDSEPSAGAPRWFKAELAPAPVDPVDSSHSRQIGGCSCSAVTVGRRQMTGGWPVAAIESRAHLLREIPLRVDLQEAFRLSTVFG